MKMINFKTFMVEDDQMQPPMQQQQSQQAPAPSDQTQQSPSFNSGARTHLTHLEDHALHGGDDGAVFADSHLRDIHNMLLGKNPQDELHLSGKWDGAPSVIYGIDPNDGKFFLGTKGVFNKTPKMAKSHEDIAEMFGHAPGLQAKMHDLFEHLPKIMPRKGGVFQGDLIGTDKDAEVRGNGIVSQRANLLRISAPRDSAEGKGLLAPLSFVTHTKYTGDGPVQSMNATNLDDETRATFKSHPDVNHIDPSVTVNPNNYTPEEQKAFLAHMEEARKAFLNMKPKIDQPSDQFQATMPHSEHLEAHINDMIRNDGTPSVDGYIDFLKRRHQKEVDSVKTEAAKDRKRQAFSDTLQHIMENRKAFENVLKLHGHLQNAKDVLVNVLEKNDPYMYDVNGIATGREGSVAVGKKGYNRQIGVDEQGNPQYQYINASKLNKRKEFNKLNFLEGKFQKGK